MAKKYNFSITRRNPITGNPETFQVVDCDSFEEAQQVVNKAVYDRELLEKRTEESKNYHPTSGNVTRNPVIPDGQKHDSSKDTQSGGTGSQNSGE
jgi:hypothetical protein